MTEAGAAPELPSKSEVSRLSESCDGAVDVEDATQVAVVSDPATSDNEKDQITIDEIGTAAGGSAAGHSSKVMQIVRLAPTETDDGESRETVVLEL